MARKSGSFSLGGTLEILADAPADARLQVKTVSDLTAAGSFPYKYVGMIVSVESEQKAYMLTAADPTDANNWKELGSGSDIQVAELPTASSELLGAIFMYVGETTQDYTNGYFYECVSDGEVEPTYSWEQKDIQPSGGSGSLERAITSSVSVGGISSGTSYPIGTNYDNLWKDLLNPVAYPTLTNPSATLTATGAKLLETGSTLSTTMTVTFNRGSINPAYGTSGYRSGVATDYALNGGTAQAGNTFSVTVDASQLTYQATVNYESGEQPKDSEGENYSTPLPAGSVNSSTITYEFVDAIWANTASIATVAKLALVSKGAKQKDFAFPAQTVANPEVFDIPASWNVTAVQVKNDLSGAYEDASAQFTRTDTTHDDAAGNSVAYKRYTFNLGYPTGARSVRVKWS